MPPVSKVELYAAIRRDARAGMPGRAMETKYWRRAADDHQGAVLGVA